MSKTNFTPGPWKLIEETHTNYAYLVNGEVICTFRNVPKGPNMALITAAPELYEALEYCRHTISDMTMGVERRSPASVIKKANAVLAKARGEV